MECLINIDVKSMCDLHNIFLQARLIFMSNRTLNLLIKTQNWQSHVDSILKLSSSSSTYLYDRDPSSVVLSRC